MLWASDTTDSTWPCIFLQHLSNCDVKISKQSFTSGNTKLKNTPFLIANNFSFILVLHICNNHHCSSFCVYLFILNWIKLRMMYSYSMSVTWFYDSMKRLITDTCLTVGSGTEVRHNAHWTHTHMCERWFVMPVKHAMSCSDPCGCCKEHRNVIVIRSRSC